MSENYLTKTVIFGFFIFFGSMPAGFAQEDEEIIPEKGSFETTRSFFFGINANGVKDFGDQANYFGGYNQPFGLYELLSIPQVKSELYTHTGKNFTLAQYPGLMHYNFGVGIGVTAMYALEDVNLILNGSFTKLQTTSVFTLSAEDPANPSGDNIIKLEQITGTERRTWIKAGAQFKNEMNERNYFFIELAPIVYFQKALKNEVNIEGSKYSILSTYSGYTPVKTNFMGGGLEAGFGIQTMFIKNKFTQVGINLTAGKLKMFNSRKMNYMAELYLSVYL